MHHGTAFFSARFSNLTKGDPTRLCIIFSFFPLLLFLCFFCCCFFSLCFCLLRSVFSLAIFSNNLALLAALRASELALLTSCLSNLSAVLSLCFLHSSANAFLAARSSSFLLWAISSSLFRNFPAWPFI
jgi:hypothetical protein